MINHISIPQYLLESSFCLIIFFGFYSLFLKKETYFQFNRFYLIISALFSLLIPIINIDFTRASHFAGAEQLYPIIHKVHTFQVGLNQTIAQESNMLHISIADVITWIYMAGFFVMLLKLMSGLFKLFGIINRSPKMKDKDHTLLISNDVPAASFFSYVFWQDKQDKNDPVQKTIMDHEMVHVRQWHSLDVIVMELMVIVKWFNPLIYLFRNSLKQTHEFIADQYVTDQICDKITYANILLTNKARVDLPPVSNHFYGHIRERIEMLSSKKSKWTNKLKYLAAFPLAIMLLSLFSFNLSDRLPQPIRTSFQNLEYKMLAAAESNIISLNMDEDEKKQKFHLSWSEIMNITLSQKGETQDLIFKYSRENLNKLLSENPVINQNGKELKIFVDTIEVLKDNHKMNISLADLADETIRKIFIDSLNLEDQITLGIRSYSDTDSLRVNLHLSIDKNSEQKWFFQENGDTEILNWGQKEIVFTDKIYHNGSKYMNLDHNITDGEIDKMLESKIMISIGDNKFQAINEALDITFTVSRANNSRLASIDADDLAKHKSEKNISDDVVFIRSYYHGKTYSIKEESQSYSVGEFYQKKEEFKNWLTQIQNGDYIQVDIKDPEGQYSSFAFNLRYRDMNEAISAPFPVALPNTTGSFSNFQIAMNDLGKSYVRMDINKPENRSIVKAYSGSESYEIVHIENFKTKYRIRETTLPVGEFSMSPLLNPNVRDIDIITLNDHYTNDDELVRMDWGKMVSLPNIGNYSLKEFKRSSKDNLSLFAGTKDIPMERYDMLIIPENGKIKRIRTDKLNTQSLREEMDKVQPNTSIYIDNIIVNIDGEQKYYPYNFVFTVE